MMKKILLVFIIGLLFIASVSAFSFFQKQESSIDYKPQILLLLNDRHEEFVMYSDVLGIDSACLYVGNTKYTITRDSISNDCSLFHMYSVSIEPEVLYLRTNEEFINAYAEGKIIPSKTTITSIAIKCRLSNTC